MHERIGALICAPPASMPSPRSQTRRWPPRRPRFLVSGASCRTLIHQTGGDEERVCEVAAAASDDDLALSRASRTQPPRAAGDNRAAEGEEADDLVISTRVWISWEKREIRDGRSKMLFNHSTRDPHTCYTPSVLHVRP